MNEKPYKPSATGRAMLILHPPASDRLVYPPTLLVAAARQVVRLPCSALEWSRRWQRQPTMLASSGVLLMMERLGCRPPSSALTQSPVCDRAPRSCRRGRGWRCSRGNCRRPRRRDRTRRQRGHTAAPPRPHRAAWRPRRCQCCQTLRPDHEAVPDAPVAPQPASGRVTLRHRPAEAVLHAPGMACPKTGTAIAGSPPWSDRHPSQRADQASANTSHWFIKATALEGTKQAQVLAMLRAVLMERRWRRSPRP